MIIKILIWIIGLFGLFLVLGAIYAMRINEQDIKSLREKIRTAKPWDLTDFWEKQLYATENAQSRAVVGLIIGGILVLFFLIYLFS